MQRSAYNFRISSSTFVLTDKILTEIEAFPTIRAEVTNYITLRKIIVMVIMIMTIIVIIAIILILLLVTIMV